MKSSPKGQSKVSAVPSFIAAFDSVLTRADQDIPVELDSDSLETMLSKYSQYASVLRADDVFSLLSSGDTALIAGSIGRSLVESAVAERWYLSRGHGELPRSATLALERENIVKQVHDQGLSVPNLERWNNPLPDARFAGAPVGPSLPNLQSGLSTKAPSSVEAITQLPAPMVDLLAMCTHVNHAASWLTVIPGEHQLGVTASTGFSALLAQSTGLSLAAVRGFPFESTVLDLVATSTAVHDFDLLAPLGKPKDIEASPGGRPATSMGRWLENPPPSTYDIRLAKLELGAAKVWQLVNDAPNPFEGTTNVSNLTAALPYLAARGILLRTLTSLRGGCSPFLAPTGARMLLEQGSELAWRTADTADAELASRYAMVMDDATDRKKSLEQKLLSRTSSRLGVEKLLYPLGRGPFAVDHRRSPQNQKSRPPAPGVHLDALNLGDAEPNWGGLAYKLLTQVAHATPLGVLHVVARQIPGSGNPALSHEMAALTIDAACIGAALTFRSLAPVIAMQAGLPTPTDWLRELFEAVRDVHAQAQLLHFLG